DPLAAGAQGAVQRGQGGIHRLHQVVGDEEQVAPFVLARIGDVPPADADVTGPVADVQEAARTDLLHQRANLVEADRGRTERARQPRPDPAQAPVGAHPPGSAQAVRVGPLRIDLEEADTGGDPPRLRQRAEGSNLDLDRALPDQVAAGALRVERVEGVQVLAG